MCYSYSGRGLHRICTVSTAHISSDIVTMLPYSLWKSTQVKCKIPAFCAVLLPLYIIGLVAHPLQLCKGKNCNRLEAEVNLCNTACPLSCTHYQMGSTEVRNMQLYCHAAVRMVCIVHLHHALPYVSVFGNIVDNFYSH